MGQRVGHEPAPGVHVRRVESIDGATASGPIAGGAGAQGPAGGRRPLVRALALILLRDVTAMKLLGSSRRVRAACALRRRSAGQGPRARAVELDRPSAGWAGRPASAWAAETHSALANKGGTLSLGDGRAPARRRASTTRRRRLSAGRAPTGRLHRQRASETGPSAGSPASTPSGAAARGAAQVLGSSCAALYHRERLNHGAGPWRAWAPTSSTVVRTSARSATA